MEKWDKKICKNVRQKSQTKKKTKTVPSQQNQRNSIQKKDKKITMYQQESTRAPKRQHQQETRRLRERKRQKNMYNWEVTSTKTWKSAIHPWAGKSQGVKDAVYKWFRFWNFENILIEFKQSKALARITPSIPPP